VEKPVNADSEPLSRLEHHLGRVLVAGVILSAVLLAAGLAMWLADPSGAQAAWSLNAGLLVLIATPIMRVVVSFTEYVRMRDWLFVAMTLVVLAELSLTVAVALARR
jgi:uncharacterized membrane protein